MSDRRYDDAETLRERGADVNARDDEGRTHAMFTVFNASAEETVSNVRAQGSHPDYYEHMLSWLRAKGLDLLATDARGDLASFNATRHLRPLVQLAREMGGDVELVLAGAGLSEARLLEQNPRIPFE